ncbi:MAG: integrase family protein [Xanthobacteraceae bacterium]|jgi:integrase|nr:integrase family protein [Xanthobacteraceae bacterium]
MRMAYPSPKLNRTSGRWRFRKVVPEALRARIGKTEIVRWLGTDRDEARRRNAELHAEWEARFAALADGITVLSRKQALALAGRWYQWFVARHDDDASTTPEGWQLSLEALQALEATGGLLDERDISPLDETPRGPKTTQRVHAFLHDRGHLAQFFLDEGVTLAPASLPLFMEAMEDQFYAAHQRLMQLASGDYSPDERPARFPMWERTAPVSKPSGSAAASGEKLTLPALFKQWKDAHPEISPGTLKVYAPSIRACDAFLNGMDVRSITEDDLWRWVKHRLEVEGVSGKTIRDNSLTALKSVLGWAASYEGGRLLTSNAAATVKPKTPKRVRERQPNFRADEIEAVLGAALAVQDDPKNPTQAFTRRWVPWLCAYTGARVREMTQLRGVDVRQEGGVWVLDITPEAGTVKSGQARRAFLHEHLVELGFPAFVASRGLGPLFYDPERRQADAKTSQAETRALHLAKWVRDTAKLDPRLQPNHAWRHTLKTRLTEAKVEPSIRDILVGHTVKGVARSYEHVSPEVLVAELNKVPRYEVD